MKRVFYTLFAGLFLLTGAAVAKPFSEMFPGPHDGIPAEALKILESLDYQQGLIKVSNGFAEVDVGEDYYYLNAWDARKVLEELWGNPPGETLGMLVPAKYTLVDPKSWVVEFVYEPIGYVKDDDAASYDYDDLMKRMQADVAAGNDWRRENGYFTQELVGWATTPHYDAQTHKLYWAQEFKFENAPSNTLNYYIRVLGRKGVLNLNFIADMSSLSEVEQAVPTVLDIVNFTEGNRYADFDPATDRVADASIGNLIGGDSFAQAGLIAVAVLFLKKFWFVLLIPLFWLKNLFTGRRNS